MDGDTICHGLLVGLYIQEETLTQRHLPLFDPAELKLLGRGFPGWLCPKNQPDFFLSAKAGFLRFKGMKSGDLFIVMGVSGSGKTTVARMLAESTGGTWLDGDDFHSVENKAKMTAGIPLTDGDRWPWLDVLNAKLRAVSDPGKPLFLACSALRQKYRDRLTNGLPEARFVYLKGSLKLIQSRLAQRRHHFMPAGLLESQFADLEEPADAIVLDISKTEDQICEDFLRISVVR